MHERRSNRDRRRPQHAGDAWINMPPLIRMTCAIAIIFVVGWLVLQIVQLVTTLTFILSR